MSESGTVVPQSKTLRAQRGLAYCRRPFLASRVPACLFDLHAAIMAHLRADKKPTVVFLA